MALNELLSEKFSSSSCIPSHIWPKVKICFIICQKMGNVHHFVVNILLFLLWNKTCTSRLTLYRIDLHLVVAEVVAHSDSIFGRFSFQCSYLSNDTILYCWWMFYCYQLLNDPLALWRSTVACPFPLFNWTDFYLDVFFLHLLSDYNDKNKSQKASQNIQPLGIHK